MGLEYGRIEKWNYAKDDFVEVNWLFSDNIVLKIIVDDMQESK